MLLPAVDPASALTSMLRAAGSSGGRARTSPPAPASAPATATAAAAPTAARTALASSPASAPATRHITLGVILAAALRETGQLFILGGQVARGFFRRPFSVRELLEQFWFITSVTWLPAALVSIPFGAVIALQVGSLIGQFGAESFTGGASVLAVIQQGSPLIVSLLIAGAGGTAICADLGSRKIREELDAMEVMGVPVVQRLLVPRVLAAMGVAVLLNGLVSVVGVLGGYFFNVTMQGGTPGAYLSSFAALAQLPDLYVGELKALLFGFVAAIVAAYRGLHPRGGPKGVGDAVNQAVVITFVVLFLVNAAITGVYLQLVPPKGA